MKASLLGPGTPLSQFVEMDQSPVISYFHVVSAAKPGEAKSAKAAVTASRIAFFQEGFGAVCEANFFSSWL
jgi:hypothetical protein